MTNKLEQAARQALEALEVSTDWDVGAKGKQLQSMKAITALREALAKQAEQEPVAWMDENGWASIYKDELYTRPLYAAPVRTKDLTDDEIRAVWLKVIDPDGGDEVMALARAVIAKFKEKNNVK